MRLLTSLITCGLVFFASSLPVSDGILPSGHSTTIDMLMERAISSNLVAGGIVVVGNRNGIIYTTAAGRFTSEQGSPPIDEHTIFDVASLTKVIATTPAVMKLLDKGHISLLDPLSRWFREFKGPGREQITILNLLTHTSGLVDFDLRHGQGIKTAIRKAAAQKNRQRPGSSFNYADINFILLGEVVNRVSGRTLDGYCNENIFIPLGARETAFLPRMKFSGNKIAPTLGFKSGVVEDANARRLGGVAGHSGLFSSSCDLARFARMMLGGGAIDGRRILSETAVNRMITPYFCENGRVTRGLGWDMESPFSAPKGCFFSNTSFGHTGYSGSSIWIDPQRDLFVVLLTTRRNYRNTVVFNQFRRDVSTIAAAGVAPRQNPTPAPPSEASKTTADLLQGNLPAQPPLQGIKITAAAEKPSAAVRKEAKKKISKPHRRKINSRNRRA